MTSSSKLSRLTRRVISFTYAFARADGSKRSIILLHSIISRLRSRSHLSCTDSPRRASLTSFKMEFRRISRLSANMWSFATNNRIFRLKQFAVSQGDPFLIRFNRSIGKVPHCIRRAPFCLITSQRHSKQAIQGNFRSSLRSIYHVRHCNASHIFPGVLLSFRGRSFSVKTNCLRYVIGTKGYCLFFLTVVRVGIRSQASGL